MWVWIVAGWLLVNVLLVVVAALFPDRSRLHVTDEEWSEWREYCRSHERCNSPAEPQPENAWRMAS